VISVDFHSHSLFSGCGVHTIVEMLTAAKALGMAGLAITDHGPSVGGRANSVFFERLRDPVPGIRLLKGMECNPNPQTYATDCPMLFLPFMDIVLLGLHESVPAGLGREAYTDLIIGTLKKNPFVDLLTHPNSKIYPTNYEALAEVALQLDVALELNNSKVDMQRVANSETEALILACKRIGCEVAVTSDAHSLHEIGLDGQIRALMNKHQFSETQIVNRDADSAFAYIARRKERKKV
jgi:putative hydrolase